MLRDLCPQFAILDEKADGDKVKEAVFVETDQSKHKGAVKCLHLLVAVVPFIPQAVWADLIWSLALAVKRGILYFAIFQIRDWSPAGGQAIGKLIKGEFSFCIYADTFVFVV